MLPVENSRTMMNLFAVFALSALLAATAHAQGTYAAGDFHNHTTCSDGSISMKKLFDKSARVFGLAWFVQSEHGGSYTRNCTLAEDPFEPAAPYPRTGQPAASGKGPNQTWEATVGRAAIQGDGTATPKRMWRWQMIQEYQYPVAQAEGRAREKPIWIGLEQNAPGHEHVSTTVLAGQRPWPASGTGSAALQAQYEYCFDRLDTDTSRGAGNAWQCAVTGSANNALLDATAAKITGSNSPGTPDLGHVKTLEGIRWLAEHAPGTSYFVPAHLERGGVYQPAGNGGYNIEHLRDFNNAAPAVAFGFESMPGHQASATRGEYAPDRRSVGTGTYGGTGIYAARIGGVWDALLGEGRAWWFFASSDYHHRGAFGPDQRESTQDFYPGEYTKDYVMVRRGQEPLTAEGIIAGLRSGNSFVATGDLVDRLAFVVCDAHRARAIEQALVDAVNRNEDARIAGCAGMGEKLVVRGNADLLVAVAVRDPQGTNNAPYAFANPSLLQVGITQPLNAPVLDHVDVIGGLVTGYVDPRDTARYAGEEGTPAASNPSAKLRKVFNATNWKAVAGGVRVMSYHAGRAKSSQYFRLRGTNLPAAVPYETDADGNPILDYEVAPFDQAVPGRVPCTDAACPAHLRKDANGAKYSSFDVAGWSDLWFYGNPVFVEVMGGTRVAGVPGGRR